MKLNLVSSALVLLSSTAPLISAERICPGGGYLGYNVSPPACGPGMTYKCDRNGNPICIGGNSSYQYQHAYTGGGYQDGYNYHDNDNPGYQQYTNGPAGYQGTPYYNNGYPGNAYNNGVFVAGMNWVGNCRGTLNCGENEHGCKCYEESNQYQSNSYQNNEGYKHQATHYDYDGNQYQQPNGSSQNNPGHQHRARYGSGNQYQSSGNPTQCFNYSDPNTCANRGCTWNANMCHP